MFASLDRLVVPYSYSMVSAVVNSNCALRVYGFASKRWPSEPTAIFSFIYIFFFQIKIHNLSFYKTFSTCKSVEKGKSKELQEIVWCEKVTSKLLKVHRESTLATPSIRRLPRFVNGLQASVIRLSMVFYTVARNGRSIDSPVPS